MLLRTSLTSKVLLEGQYGAILALQHLTPFLMEPTAAAAGGDGSGGEGGRQVVGQQQQQQQQRGTAVGAGSTAAVAAAGRNLHDDAARRAFFDSVSGGVGILLQSLLCLWHAALVHHGHKQRCLLCKAVRGKTTYKLSAFSAVMSLLLMTT